MLIIARSAKPHLGLDCGSGEMRVGTHEEAALDLQSPRSTWGSGKHTCTEMAGKGV